MDTTKTIIAALRRWHINSNPHLTTYRTVILELSRRFGFELVPSDKYLYQMEAALRRHLEGRDILEILAVADEITGILERRIRAHTNDMLKSAAELELQGWREALNSALSEKLRK